MKTKYLLYILIVLIASGSLNCKKCRDHNTDGSTLPIIPTKEISAITTSSASSGGDISSDDGAIVTERGICWNTRWAPTNLNDHTSNGTGIDLFTSSISGFLLNITYYVRAYATNSVGTAYGNEIRFKNSDTSYKNIYVVGYLGIAGLNSYAILWKNSIRTNLNYCTWSHGLEKWPALC